MNQPNETGAGLENLCDFLSWDSDFFGKRIGRVNPPRLDAQKMQEILAWSRENAIDCLYFQADAGHPQTIRLAEDHGFHLTEVRMTYERRLHDWEILPIPRYHEDVLIRLARPEDVPAMQAMASTSYTSTHYVVDPCFSAEKVQEFYETWIKNSVMAGFDDVVLAAELDGEVIGFNSGRFVRQPQGKGEKESQLILIGVKPDLRKHGLGYTLLHSTVDWLAQNGSDHVIGVVQASNIVIHRLLQKLGFFSAFSQLYYHKWFSNCDK